jgi:hypothetical protein
MSQVVRGSLCVAVAAAVVGLGGCKKAEIPTSAPNPTGLRKEKGYRVRSEPPATPDQIAAFNLLDEDKQKFKEAMDGLPADTQAPEFTKRLRKYVEFLDSKKPEDYAGCPPDMKAEFPKYRDACKKVIKYMGMRPAGEGTDFMTALKDMYSRDFEKHTPTYGKDFTDAMKDMTRSYLKLVTLAESAGLEFFDSP